MAETSTNVSDSSAPLLLPSQGSTARSNTISLLLGRATGHRGPSNLVRETAALQLDERRADWGYSKPVVAIDIAWNLASTDVSVVLLASTFKERPNTPIRVWLCGYALQCLVHAILVWLEYRRRTMRRNQSIEDGIESSDSDLDDSEDDVGGYRIGNRWSVAKRCKSVNTVASFLWWILGFYWVVSGGEILSQNAPHLYWLAVIFLAFDVFFAMVCVLLACMIGIALCCCLPCIIAILYAMADQEGATESDIKFLPKYSYKKNYSNEEKPSAGAGSMVPIETSSGDLPDEHVILPEDAECCICLNSYEDGAELHVLPCSHHFHATCVVKWLKINASCPLCKYNILKGNHEQV